MADFSHLAADGTAQMVDVGDKSSSLRRACVVGQVRLRPDLMPLLSNAAEREIISVARVAGIQALKLTAQLIPMCHQVAIDHSTVDISLDRDRSLFHIKATARTTAKTGVEMETLVAAKIAAAAIYDMIKAQAPETVIGPFWVDQKQGGKIGHWQNPHDSDQA